MTGIRFGRRATHQLMGAGLAILLVFTAVACGSDDEPSSTSNGAGSASSATASAPTGDPLGAPNPASGEPVVVGLITTGGDCAQCSEGGAIETPAAEAAVAYVNEYLAGIAGRPMKLVVCNNELDPSKATDCANQMISDGAAAVITGADSTVTGWQVLHDAGVPVFSFATAESRYLEDPDSTFVMQDPEALTVEFPIAAAKEAGATKVSIIVVDLPAATDIYTDATKQKFMDAGLEVEIVPVPIGTPDMTPQAQQIVQSNSDGLVNIVGHDAFCIPAINGLLAAGFTGKIATISFCVTDTMREAVPSTVLDGMLLAASDTLGDASHPSTQLYKAVLDKYAAGRVPPEQSSGVAMFASFTSLALSAKGLTGDVTPASIITAARSMDNEVLPGSGGRHFRCNGKASETGPSVCSASGLTATLNAQGVPDSYEVFNDDPIPG